MEQGKKVAMIFAAGLGTRLRPITDTIPKALLPYRGKPLLESLLLKLKYSGFTRIVINVHHLAEQIEEFVEERERFGLDISFSDERDFLRETGGGIRHAEKLITGGDLSCSEPFLAHNVDIVSDLDIESFYNAHKSDDAPNLLASLLVSERKTSRYFLFDDDLRLMGWCNTATGEVRSPFPHFNPDNCRKLAFGGVHTLSPKVFPLMREYPERFSIVDFYLSMADKYLIRGICPEHIELTDAGKIDILKN